MTAFTRELTDNADRPASPRIPALDGVRGIAVLMVAAFHLIVVGLAAQHPEVQASTGRAFHAIAKIAGWGWMGVDLFFVLSGFLITGILFDAKGSPGYFRGFYARRALRIFPAYYLLLVIVLLLVPALWPRIARDGLQVSGPHSIYWLYVSNFHFALRGPGGVLSHTWSLAIEEQFYFAWPAAVLLLGRRAMLRACSAIAIGSIALRAILVVRGWDPIAISFVTFCRLDALACGGIVALLWRGPDGDKSVKRTSIVAVLLAPTLMAILRLAQAKLHAGRAIQTTADGTLAAALFAGAIGLAVVGSFPGDRSRRPWGFSRALAIAPLRFLGRYSYGIYLVHLPLIVAAYELGCRPATTPQRLAYVLAMPLAILACALLSWHAFEKQFLKLKPPR